MLGVIEGYGEQGWEGRIDFVFRPAQGDPVWLTSGQHLTIFGPDGATLWSGKLNFVKLGFFDKHKLEAGVWSYIKQKGVSYHDWMSWFWHHPPLEAELDS